MALINSALTLLWSFLETSKYGPNQTKKKQTEERYAKFFAYVYHLFFSFIGIQNDFRYDFADLVRLKTTLLLFYLQTKKIAITSTVCSLFIASEKFI